MSVRKQISENEGVYFITITCYKWLHLFNKVDGYNMVYNQFEYLQKQGHYIVGYVIMPNHLHAVIAFKDIGKTINSIIGNVKRFMAYEIVKQLQLKGEVMIIETLTNGVNATDKKRGKLHEVFEPSFDCKECRSIDFINQKLNYIHNNPCTGIWNLATSPVAYYHSSAKYYITGEEGVFKVTNYMKLEDINLTNASV